MPLPEQPKLRRVESFPISQPDGQVVFALRDPEGFSGSVAISFAAAVLASFMDGTRTLGEIADAYRERFGQPVAPADLEQLVRDLDDRLFLDTDRFRARWKHEIEHYLNSPSRPAAHAGAAYPAEADALREQMSALFSGAKGPEAPEETAAASDGRLLGVLSPHVDLHRGGSAFAFAYQRIAEQCDADLFVIFGTSHNPMRHLFSVTRKHFETPLGTVETDRRFAARLAANRGRAPGDQWNLAADELAHRQEHSIEFQVLFLQYLLGGQRAFKVVPVLVGSFHEFIQAGTSPIASPEVAAFVEAMKRTAAEHSGRMCYVSGGDLAHIGRRYGDQAFLDPARLKQQADDDRRLLDSAARADAEALFRHVAAQQDRHRICGLSPTYTMLEVMRPGRGELLRYDQAVELDGTSCVSFASMAFYE